MIARMKKVFVLCMAERREQALSVLRDLGVLHLTPVRDPKSEDVDRALAAVRRREQALSVLTAIADESDGRTGSDAAAELGLPDAETLARETLRADEQRKTARERGSAVSQEIEALEALGDFDPQSIEALEARGVTVRLFRRRGPDAPGVPDGFHFAWLSREGRQGVYVLAGQGAPETEDEPIPLPSRSLSAARAEARALREQSIRLDRTLQALSEQRALLAKGLTRARDRLRFAEAQAGMEAQGAVAYVRGYSPADRVPALRQAAAEHGWGLRVAEPDSADQPPSLIRHPRWVRPIQSVLDMIGILPGYREVDISAVFLLFLSVFFAMIVGDAGYGALFLAGTLAARKKMPNAPSEPFRLLRIFSVSTIVWGLLIGNVFGIEALPSFLAWMQVEWLAADENVMQLCFLLGAVQLSIAHAWNLVRYLNTWQAVAQAGWIAITWVMFFTARAMILEEPFPGWAFALLAVGVLAVVLFMTPRRRLKAEWTAHVMLPLTVINNFVDVVSYVRLFAVGTASLAVAQAFNAIAGEIGGAGMVAGLGAALILFVGHALNIVLCMLGVLVHGVRLNVLEFSGHIGMQWTGMPYKPFAPEAESEKLRSG